MNLVITIFRPNYTFLIRCAACGFSTRIVSAPGVAIKWLCVRLSSSTMNIAVAMH